MSERSRRRQHDRAERRVERARAVDQVARTERSARKLARAREALARIEKLHEPPTHARGGVMRRKGVGWAGEGVAQVDHPNPEHVKRIRAQIEEGLQRALSTFIVGTLRGDVGHPLLDIWDAWEGLGYNVVRVEYADDSHRVVIIHFGADYVHCTIKVV